LEFIKNPSLTSLSGLENITEIGYLFIWDNDILEDFSGLDSLIYINGYLKIKNNVNLLNFNGLGSLTEIGEFFEVSGNDALIDFIGLGKLDSVGSSFDILNNNALTSLNGLTSLNILYSELNIGQNDALLSLSGLENLTDLNGHLNIYENKSLMSLSGLDNLSSLGSNLSLVQNDSLESISELSNLFFMDGDLSIMENPALTSLSGLDNLYEGGNSSPITNLVIKQNASLSSCEVQSICLFLADSEPGTANISDNASGCNTEEEVDIACQILGIDDIEDEVDLLVYPNPAVDQIFIEFSNAAIVQEISIYNQLGQNLLQIKHYSNYIDVSFLEPGTYIIELVTDKTKTRRKLMKK